MRCAEYVVEKFRFSFLVACGVHGDRCPSLMRVNLVRVVLLRNSRALLRERLVVLGGLLSETPSTLRLV